MNAGDPISALTAGYHRRVIPKGTFGHASKIVEEIAEFSDALEQGCEVMALVELSDAIGAIEGWLKRNHPTLSIHDLIKMSRITQRAFENGHRESTS